ncbi:MAG: adenylate/guanylate cyclase domain-containing protein, partial [Acetobacteraceae bacterium]|nr:adenylate/guanylate cyclase domain-containing protein [Acetobacteraceae bacterium]
RAADHALIWGAATLGAGIVLLAPPAGWALVAGLGTIGAIAALLVAGLAADGAGWLLPVLPAALSLLLAAVTAAALLEGLGHRQRQRIRRSFEHYLDPQIVRRMLAGDTPPSLGGEHREITALFTDIAGFTGLAERLPAPQLAELLNSYFEGMAEAVIRHGGLVNDFVGDGLIALFGAPMEQPDHAARAVAAAEAADAFARDFAQRLAKQGIAFGHTRIGVHTGSALVGNLGTRSRLKYGALGDTLNVAARLESLNRWIGTRILVSGETASRAGAATLRLVGEAALAGRAAPIAVWSPWLAEAETAGRYAAAMEALRDGDAATARRLLDALAETRPDDLVILFHRRRLAEGVCGLAIVPGGK